MSVCVIRLDSQVVMKIAYWKAQFLQMQMSMAAAALGMLGLVEVVVESFRCRRTSESWKSFIFGISMITCQKNCFHDTWICFTSREVGFNSSPWNLKTQVIPACEVCCNPICSLLGKHKT